ncbi:enhancer of polycomb homolog 1 [Anthonomus grandis grandis]|uniref:enhancer of polycomb homolog 1 n=1 Tax=Anthonomus grandis grandis TaxID=2921223 RepID=UPI002165700C|nr:enhancer of polycomb homolog 1 [Anthonomus grandis grandis]
MSKLSFRARALDPSKPMPVYMAEELPDLPDFSAINRAVPQMPTGMQKEEECEHHLQRAICAGLIIPTPEVTDVPLKDFYDRVYPSNYKQPRQLIHMQPFTMEQEIPDYDMDSDDERWLLEQQPRLDLSPLKFEEMMDRLEKSSGQTVVTLAEAKALLKEDDELTIAVFDYWLNKRLKTQHPLILSVRTEHRSGQAANNPYLAFRRRTEKMQTRKNRKNDEVSYEKMLKLRRDLVRAVTLLELVKRREKCKREFVHLTVEVFEKRFQAKDYSGTVVAEAAASKAALAAAATPRPAFTPIFHNHHHHSQSSTWADAVVSQAQHAAVQHHKTKEDQVIGGRREKRQYKKRKHKPLSGRAGVLEGLSSDEEIPGLVPRGPTPEPEEPEDEGPFAFRRNQLCSYHKPRPTMGNWPWCAPEENGGGDKRFRFSLTSLSNRKCVGFARRRVGRGGRIILDRASTDCDEFWRGLDFSIIEPKPSTCIKDDPLSVRLKEEETPLWTKNSTSTYNKYSAVSASSGSSSTFTLPSFGGDFSSSAVTVKIEPVDEQTNTTVKPAEMTGGTNEDDSVEYLRALRRDMLHFRPKTPPEGYEPPCHLLPPDDPPFANDSLPSFQMEVEPVDSSLFLLDRGPFLTDTFELDRRWAEEPPQDIFEESPEDENAAWRNVGVSCFTLTDAGGERKGRSGGPDDSGSFFDEDLEYDSLSGRKNDLMDTSQGGQEIGSTNGLVSFMTDVSSNRRKLNSNSATTLSLLKSAQSVTLNSHSANHTNLLDYPLTAAVDVAVDPAAPPHQATPPLGGGSSSAPKSNNGGVTRNNKNNSMVMEVT